MENVVSVKQKNCPLSAAEGALTSLLENGASCGLELIFLKP